MMGTDHEKVMNKDDFAEETSNSKPIIDSFEDPSCTVDCGFGLSMEEFSLLLGYSLEGTTNGPWIGSGEMSRNHMRKQAPQINEIKWEFIWKLKLPTTLISFLRSICMNVLSVGNKDIRSTLKTCGRCPFGCPVEADLDHIFMRCSLSRAVWFGTTLRLKVENVSPSSIQLWILSILVRSQQDDKGKAKAFLEWVTCVCWCIYEHMREVIFHHEKPSPSKVLHHLSDLMKEVNNIHHKSPQSQDSHEQTDEEMVKYLEEKLSESKGNDTLRKTSDERQITAKARDAERIQQENIIQILKSECNKLKKELKEEREFVQRLKREKDNEAYVAQRKIKEISQELANARRSVKCVSTEAYHAKNKWIKTNRELKEEHQLVQLLKRECEETRKSAMRQIEEKELLLSNASMAAAAAESRAIAAEEKLFDHDKEIKSSEDKVCAICLNNEKDMAFGCGHTTCGDCGLAVSLCPICRKRITSRLRLFLG